MTVNEQSATQLLYDYVKTDSLRLHGKTVRGVMRYFADKYGEDVEYWGVVGLLHDLDYEQFPDQHCTKTAEILKENNYDDEFIHAVVSHGFGICSDVEPILKMEKVLYATDELTGLIAACAYMRPSKSVMDLELKSVKKKFKAKAFAAGVNREVIQKGTDMLEMPLDDLINETILAMRSIADEIGLGLEN